MVLPSMDGKVELADRQYADAAKSAAGNPNVIVQYVAFLQRQAGRASGNCFDRRDRPQSSQR